MVGPSPGLSARGGRLAEDHPGQIPGGITAGGHEDMAEIRQPVQEEWETGEWKWIQFT